MIERKLVSVMLIVVGVVLLVVSATVEFPPRTREHEAAHAQSAAIPPGKCVEACAPRLVLASDPTTCVCAPDEAWIFKVIDKADQTCGPVPFEVKADRDGTIEIICGRPQLMKRR